MPDFANPELNGKYEITGEDHHVDIPNKSCRFKGMLSQITEAGIKYLIGQGHKIVAEKVVPAKQAPAKENPAK